VTAVNLQVEERQGGDCEDVDSFPEPPTSDNQVALPDGEMEPVLPGTADTFESIECQLGILLAEEESSFE
jgi:hypothetical protein